ncbi:MAG: UvrD-helicase domain-containing protein [Pseudomonadales bacterium]|jgi:ATP-dependent exoDNAse (exonuclease V) beta subunit|nr:UvrD-helicase domain-containing protein [Pseudomonadales bacterium]
MSSLLDDAAERQTALDITRSFCVQAPAGSGKTELLTQRLLKLLAQVEQPEEILAFTFTRKAAAEMRERLLHSLREAQAREALPPEERPEIPAHYAQRHTLAKAVLARDATQGWKLLNNPRRLRLNTIDSFTAWLTAQLPLSANFGARATLTTDMQPLLRNAIHGILARLDANDATGSALRSLLPHLQNDLSQAEKLLLRLLEKREQWLELALTLQRDPNSAKAAMESTLQTLIEDELQNLQELFMPHATALLELTQFAAAHLEQQPEHELHALAQVQKLPSSAADELPLWRILCRFLLVKNLENFRKAPKASEGFPAKDAARNKDDIARFAAAKETFKALCATLESQGALPQLQVVARLPDPYYSASQWQLLHALCQLLPLLVAQLNVAMQEAGMIDHTETSIAALRALGDDSQPSDLALLLDYRIRHILVDEFQDTSILQFQLLEKLTADWQNGDGRTLFIVGDGMQSCYAFRNAKVSLFLRARDQGIGGVPLEALELKVNFRSDASVVNWVNRVFNNAFPQRDDLARGGVRYSPSSARDTAMLSVGVHCHLWVQAPQVRDSSARRLQEAEAIADLCERLQQENPSQNIAILVRNRGHLQELVPALRQRGLRWNASKIDPLLSYPVIGDLLTLLRALLSLADATAWFALLRSPCIGLALDDLLVLAEQGQERQQSVWSTLHDYANIAALSEDARARLARAVPALERARLLRQQRPLREVLELLWLALGGPACLNDGTLLPNVATFFALVEAASAHGDIADLRQLERQLERAYGSTLAPDVKLELMTIHNAKGLEFDQVIVPGLDRLPRNNDRELLLWHEQLDADGHGRPLLALLPAKDAPDDPLYTYLQFEHKQRDLLEATRLLYIAVTRAIHGAWLFGCVQEQDEGYKAPANSLLQRILPALLSAPAELQVRFEPLDSPAATESPATLPRLLTQPLFRLHESWPAPELERIFPAAPPPLTPSEPHTELLPRLRGELVHLGLKLLVQRGSAWLEALERAPYWRQMLAPLCNDESQLHAELSMLRAQLETCLRDPQTAWLFQNGLSDDACELALVDYSGGARRDHVVDRSFIDAQGTRWIIDYKSAQCPPGQDEAEFITEQCALYHDQLARYARLFAARGAAELRCALLFTALPRLVSMDC